METVWICKFTGSAFKKWNSFCRFELTKKWDFCSGKRPFFRHGTNSLSRCEYDHSLHLRDEKVFLRSILSTWTLPGPIKNIAVMASSCYFSSILFHFLCGSSQQEECPISSCGGWVVRVGGCRVNYFTAYKKSHGGCGWIHWQKLYIVSYCKERGEKMH